MYATIVLYIYIIFILIAMKIEYTKNIAAKMAVLIFFLVVFAVVFSLSTVAYAQNANNSCGSDPLSAAFGCNSIINSGRGIDIGSIITLFFRGLLIASGVWTVWYFALAGFKIGSAKEDANKRQEGIKAAVNAVLGLVVALLSFGTTSLITGAVGGSAAISAVGTPCTAVDDQTQLVFTGFMEQEGGSVYCVLRDAQGNQLRRGPVTSRT
jgi:membrane-associated HD superfamily phosphohydrolase